MKKLLLVMGVLFLFLSLLKETSSQNTIDEAVTQIKAITNPDPYVQDRLRAEKAFQIVTNRVEVLNDFSGTFLQTLPVDFWNYFEEEGNIKTRAEVIALARNKGWSLAEVAWIIKGGQCDEHASLMQMLLQRSGVPNVKILRSNSPHAFPVVNALPGFDPDNPWTWGSHAFVPDTWAGKIINPLDTWYENHDFLTSIYFKKGEYYVDMGSLTNRQRLMEYKQRGNTFIKEHCNIYRQLLKSYLKYPEDVRAQIGINPPLNICDDVPINRLILVETTFEVYDSETRTYIEGQEKSTPTSKWTIDKGSFSFHSVKDDFDLKIYWDQPPEIWEAFENIPFQINMITRGGPRKASVSISPVWDMTVWDIRMPEQYENDMAKRLSVNWLALTIEKDSISGNDLYKEAILDYTIMPVGKNASTKETFVKDGNGKFYAHDKPGEFDMFFLQINCNTLAKIKWTFVPEGSPYLNER